LTRTPMRELRVGSSHNLLGLTLKSELEAILGTPKYPVNNLFFTSNNRKE